MAGEAELNAFFQIVKSATEGKTIVRVDYQAATELVEFELSNGVVIRMPVAKVITAALEAS